MDLVKTLVAFVERRDHNVPRAESPWQGQTWLPYQMDKGRIKLGQRKEQRQCWVGAMSRRLKSGQQEQLGEVNCDQDEEFRPEAPNKARKWFK